MRRLVFLFLVFAVAYAGEGRRPKLYKVDLDAPPEERWAEVIEDHKKYLPVVKEELQKYFKTPFKTIMCWFLEKVVLNFPEEYAKEMEGVAKLAGLEYCEVIGLNVLYDITNYNKLIDQVMGCTSIVAEDTSGRILHGRNLDYVMTGLMKNLAIMVDFTRDDKIVYSGLTYAFFSGLMTGQKPFAFTLSLNARRSGWYIQTILMQLYTAFRMPVGFGLRRVFETAENYDEALEELTHMHFISPCYLVLGGKERGEGVLITRDRMQPADVLDVNVKKDRWFIVQTNFDHWNHDEDNRRTTAEIFLNEIKHEHLDEDTMWAVLDHNPVRNNLTITRTVMSAHTPAMFYRSTVISESFP